MNPIIRTLAMLPAVLATAILAFVIIRGAQTVLALRQYDDDSYPLVAPLNALPASLIALSFLMFARHRVGSAAVLGIMALGLASLFFVSQASGTLG